MKTEQQKFPYKELTEIPVGNESILWPGPCVASSYRYLWYELGTDSFGKYLILGYKPIKYGNWISLGAADNKLFKLNLVAQLHFLITLPDTKGEKNTHIRNLVYERLRNIE